MPYSRENHLSIQSQQYPALAPTEGRRHWSGLILSTHRNSPARERLCAQGKEGGLSHGNSKDDKCVLKARAGLLHGGILELRLERQIRIDCITCVPK